VREPHKEHVKSQSSNASPHQLGCGCEQIDAT
jgi:hypothetical protein